MDTCLLPAAQYLRMSTEHQQYSLDNQADAIARYAPQNGFRVVKTYSDAARSGLRLKNRDGLKQLLKDVMEGQKEFCAVLVYDVSRWGRFQDTDEAAHYEYVCKSAGVPVHYCAEMFTNDNSVSGLILKTLKRTMAGEYSRELSAKVRRGLSRLARLGYKLGGSPRYGLRRQLLDKGGKPRQILERGERKCLVDERVVLVPGPPEEVAIVNRIFREFADEQRKPTSIASRLNQEEVPFLRGAKWSADTVRLILEDPHYIGMQVWGRTTALLATRIRRVPLDQWEICTNAFRPIISKELFSRAQQAFADLTCRLTEEQMLERVKQTIKAHGRLSARIIDKSRLCPGMTTYYKRFGGMFKLYARLGYDTPPWLVGQAASRMRGIVLRDSLTKSILESFPGQIEEVRRSTRFKPLLRYRKTGLLLSVVIARCYQTKSGASWRVRTRTTEPRRNAIVALLDRTNTKIEMLRLFPRRFEQQVNIRVGPLEDSPRTGLAMESIFDLVAVLKRARQW